MSDSEHGTSGLAQRGCRGLVGLASILVPQARRTAWREEWNAELWHHFNDPPAGPGRGPTAALVRCLGAFPHALSIRLTSLPTTSWQTVRLTGRSLVRDRVISLSIVVVIGLTVAAAATVFSSYEAVVLRALPYDEPDRLVSVWAEHEERGWYQEYVAPANLLDWRESVEAFADVAAYGDFVWERILDVDGTAEVVDAGPVSGNLFEVLGASPLLGRVFRWEETWSQSEPVAILSHGFWTQRYGGDPGVIGRRIELSGVSHEIVGVMPRDFRYLVPDRQLWVPFRFDRDATGTTFFRRAHLVRAVARLAPGVEVDAASAQLESVAARLESEYPETNAGLSAGITPLATYLVGERDSTLRALIGAVSILLLAGCVNVGYLILVRWNRRRSEIAIRKALGAGAGVLVRDAAIESLWLVAVGTALGIAGSTAGMRVMGELAPAELLASADLRISGPLIALATATMAAAALGFTLLPARASAAVGPESLARLSTRSSGSRRAKAIHGFVMLQVALSAVLIFGAALLARSFVALRNVDAGFEAAGVLTFAIPFPDGGDEAAGERARTAERLTGELSRLTGVSAVGATRRLPITGSSWTSFFSIEGQSEPGGTFEVVHREADGGYFEAMRVPILAGRLARADEADGLLVNATFARRAFGDSDPIGRRVAFTEQPTEGTRWWRIVGVVGDERQNGLRFAARPELFTHYAFDTPGTFRFVVRTDADPLALLPEVRRVVQAVDAGLPMDEIATLDSVVSASLAEERFLTLLAGAFALLAALLAVTGVYGVTAQLAQSWQREFAVRLAVGAAPRSLFGAVLTRGAAVVAGGLSVGLLASLVVGRFLEALLFETQAGDPPALLGAAVLVLTTCLAATLPSAVRAMKTDPARLLSS